MTRTVESFADAGGNDDDFLYLIDACRQEFCTCRLDDPLFDLVSLCLQSRCHLVIENGLVASRSSQTEQSTHSCLLEALLAGDAETLKQIWPTNRLQL